jgi:hypothetical protein
VTIVLIIPRIIRQNDQMLIVQIVDAPWQQKQNVSPVAVQ